MLRSVAVDGLREQDPRDYGPTVGIVRFAGDCRQAVSAPARARFPAAPRRVPLPPVNGVVVFAAGELTFVDYRGLGSPDIELFTALRMLPASVVRALNDLLPVPGLQVVHT